MKKVLTNVFVLTSKGVEKVGRVTDWINSIHIRKVMDTKFVESMNVTVSVGGGGGYVKIVTVFPNKEAFNAYDDGPRKNLRNEFTEQMIHSGLLDRPAFFEEDVEDTGLLLYRAEVQAYTEYFKKITRGFSKEQMKNLMGLLDTHDWDKTRMWTEKMKGMALILGLNEEQAQLIDEEFMQSVEA